jgi:hypothetical protein
MAAIAAPCTFLGVGKSGWPMQNETMSLPLAHQRVDLRQHNERVLRAERFCAA